MGTKKKPTRDEIRKCTALVIQNDAGEYLSRIECVTGRVVWDAHLSNAWKTRVMGNAVAVAEFLGGKVCLFNSALMEVKAL